MPKYCNCCRSVSKILHLSNITNDLNNPRAWLQKQVHFGEISAILSWVGFSMVSYGMVPIASLDLSTKLLQDVHRVNDGWKASVLRPLAWQWKGRRREGLFPLRMELMGSSRVFRESWDVDVGWVGRPATWKGKYIYILHIFTACYIWRYSMHQIWNLVPPKRKHYSWNMETLAYTMYIYMIYMYIPAFLDYYTFIQKQIMNPASSVPGLCQVGLSPGHTAMLGIGHSLGGHWGR